MKFIKFLLTTLLTLALIYLFDHQLGDTAIVKYLPEAAHSVPPIGKFMSPFTGFWRNAEAKNMPRESNLKIPGLKEEVKVIFDNRLVPHIFAQNNSDLYFSQGYITAKHRLWQMEFQTYAAAGRVSEIVGERAIDYDKFQRRMGMVLASENALQEMLANPETKIAVEAYTAGVNAYIQQLSPKNYPLEYKLLDYAPELWTPLKCALLLKYMAYSLAGGSDDLYMNNVLNTYGKEVVNELFPDYENPQEPIMPKGTAWDFEKLKIPPIPKKKEVLANTENNLPFQPHEDNGSNNWAIGAEKSATGYPILANDPHLDLNLPSLWYEIQLVSPTMNVYGASLPGSPAIIIGFNQNIAWGLTNVDADVLDFFQIKFKDTTMQAYWHDNQWKNTTRVIEKIKMRNGKIVNDTVVHTHHGPILFHQKQLLGKKYPVNHAMRWVAHDKSNELLTFCKLNQSKNYTDFQNAIATFVCPAQNFIYADIEKNIALWSNGKYPLKWPEQGKFILDGTDSQYEWQGWIPQAQNPHVKNPPRGFVSSANQAPTDATYPYYLNWQFATPQRAVRINERLQRMEKATPDSLRVLQNDNTNVLARDILPLMLRFTPAKSKKLDEKLFFELERWNYKNDADLLSPTFFQEWWTRLNNAIWQDDFGVQPDLRYPSRGVTLDIVKYQPRSRWIDNVKTIEKEDLSTLLGQTYEATYQALTKKHGSDKKNWQWAKHKATHVDHLAKIPAFGKTNLTIGGGRGIVNATSENHGPSWRMVVALGKNAKAYGIYPGGQSGNPGSYYYDNMIPKWEKGELEELLFMENVNLSNPKIISRVTLKREE